LIYKNLRNNVTTVKIAIISNVYSVVGIFNREVSLNPLHALYVYESYYIK